jgi:hypothetical protein
MTISFRLSSEPINDYLKRVPGDELLYPSTFLDQVLCLRGKCYQNIFKFVEIYGGQIHIFLDIFIQMNKNFHYTHEEEKVAGPCVSNY